MAESIWAIRGFDSLTVHRSTYALYPTTVITCPRCPCAWLSVQVLPRFWAAPCNHISAGGPSDNKGSRQGADVAGLSINHFVSGRFVGVESIFAGAARDLQGLLESHIEHPLIHYFHPPPCTQESTSDALFSAGSLRAGATVTRVQCAGGGTPGCVCPLTLRLAGANTAVVVTAGSWSWLDSPCI